MSIIFEQVPAAKVATNVFDLSHDHKLTTDMGRLTPILCEEVIPGDSWNVNTEVLVRLAPLLSPVMHRVDVTVHYFFVPNRILWPGWEDFITGNGTPAFPFLSDFTAVPSSLADYLGVPTNQGTGISINAARGSASAIPFAGYQTIFNEYYRDENLVPETWSGPLVNGSNASANLITIKQRAWQKDYFTAALPFAQKGPAVLLPLTFSDVNVIYASSPSVVRQAGTLINPAVGGATINATPPLDSFKDNSNTPLNIQTPAVADTSSLTGNTTINEFRRALRLQEWLERNARGGTRYIESMMSHFGVKSSDKRLQRPEFIGGFKEPVVISEVLQTSATDTSTPLAQNAGHGISVGGGKTQNYYAEEHGYIFAIMSILPKTAYSSGMRKHFSKFSHFDYYWPSFANLGEQEITNRELFYGTDGLNGDTFGYTPRYAEYKYIPSQISGAFNSSLNYWHLGRIFASRPLLNESFIQSDPSKRIFAVTSPGVDSLYVHTYHRIKARRKMPVFGVPTI